MFKFKKQPTERIVGVAIDFGQRLATSETLPTGTVSSALVSGTEVTPVVLTDTGKSGTSVVATVAGGTDGCVYKLTYVATGSLGNILESEILMTVKEL